MRIPQVRFVKSVAKLSDRPATPLPEVAVVGRSNVGKSSLINSVFNQRHLAKTSSTPGKTQLINYFIVDDHIHLVDLPGYGFSKVAKQVSKNWENMITGYLTNNRELKWVFLLIDSRHDLMDIDRQMINWLTDVAIPFIIILTKCDKLSRSRLSARLQQINTDLPVVTILPYSAKSHLGRKAVIDMLIGLDNEV